MTDYAVRASLNDEFFMVFMLAELVLAIAIFVGFFKWQLYSWYAVLISFFIAIPYSIISLADPTISRSFAIGQVVGSCIWFAIVYVYYKKRRPLFTDSGLDANAPDLANTPPGVNFCSSCGARIEQKANFCPRCGTNLLYKH
jgi:uncharacterized paraquat-inducible protein A